MQIRIRSQSETVFGRPYTYIYIYIIIIPLSDRFIAVYTRNRYAPQRFLVYPSPRIDVSVFDTIIIISARKTLAAAKGTLSLSRRVFIFLIRARISQRSSTHFFFLFFSTLELSIYADYPLTFFFLFRANLPR